MSLQRKLLSSRGDEANRWNKVQDPVIAETSVPEVILQFLAHAVATSLAFWLFGFEIAVLLALLLGFALINLNILAAAMSSNVHLAEIRDFLHSSKGLRNKNDDDVA